MPRETRAFFGDRTRRFALDAPMIVELERATGVGFGGLCRRLFSGDFAYREVGETIRCALIGGGESPETAAHLVSTYVDQQPVEPSFALAVFILESAWFAPAQIENGVSLGDPKPEAATHA